MDFLKQPYPYFHKGKELLRNGILIMIFAFLFEYLLEPFQQTPSERLFSNLIISLIHAGNGAVIYLILFSIIALFINDDDWKVYKEIIVLAILLLFVGIGGFFVREIIYDNPHNASLKYLVEEIRNTYLVGSILLFIIITINYRIRNHKNQIIADQMNIEFSAGGSDQNKIEIKANISADHFELIPSQLLCVKSDGNYLEFHIQNGSESQKLLKRLTLQSASQQLAKFPYIIKTHRAFLVNLQQLENVKGNAQGYQLAVKNLDFNIPVSRAHIEAFNRMVG